MKQNGKRFTYEGRTFFVRFIHENERVPVEVGGERVFAPNLRLRKLDVGGVKATKVRFAVRCQLREVLRSFALEKRPTNVLVAETIAACSRKEREKLRDGAADRELGRQGALARLLVQLPREVGAEILGWYMASARRPSLALDGFKIAATRSFGTWGVRFLRDALPRKGVAEGDNILDARLAVTKE